MSQEQPKPTTQNNEAKPSEQSFEPAQTNINDKASNNSTPQNTTNQPTTKSEEKRTKYTTLQCWLIIILTYIFAFGIGSLILVVSDEDSVSPLTIGFYTDCISTVIVFIFSLIFQNTSLYDPYWGFYPILLITYWQITSPYTGTTKNWFAWGTVLFYCLRHGFLYFRFWTGLSYEDFRYVQFREKIKSKVGFWIFSLFGLHYVPTFQVFAGLLSFYYALDTKEISIPGLYYSGLGLSIVAVIIEAIADEQLYPYRTKIKDRYIDVGLWKYSRHPNYLGEMSFWWGLYIAALAADAGRTWWTVIGPLNITCLFYFYSIPGMEERTLERRKGYKTQIKRVNKLMFWFRKNITEDPESLQTETNRPLTVEENRK